MGCAGAVDMLLVVKGRRKRVRKDIDAMERMRRRRRVKVLMVKYAMGIWRRWTG
jgi:hypothetical protein